MHQREVFDSTPGIHYEVYCFHAIAFTPRRKEKKNQDRESLSDVKTVQYNVRAA